MTVGYIVSRFPLLSETFILRELVELERQGDRAGVYALRQGSGRRHPRLEQLQAAIWWAPWVSVRSHRYWLRRRPGVYFRTLAEVVRYNWGDANLWFGAVGYWGKAVALAAQLEHDSVDRIHAHYATHPALAAYIAHRLTGLPFSFTVHAHDVQCHQRMLGRKALAADTVVAISRLNRDVVMAAIAREYACHHPRQRAATSVAVVHCGVEASSSGALGALARARQTEFCGDRSELRVLTVGSLRDYKGHRYLLDACARLRAQNIEVRCRILGGGPLGAELRRHIVQLGLHDAVRLEGAATEPEVLAALAWADAFAMPSIRVEKTGQMEGIPVALMEAMAAGLPVVASRLSGIPELITDGDEGLLVPASDAGALAEALAKLRDPELRGRLGTAGRAKVTREFDLSASVAQLRALWDRSAGDRSRGREAAA